MAGSAPLFERLSRALEAGHSQRVEGLMSDARFADAGRTAQAAVLIAVTDRQAAEGGPGVLLTQRPTTMRDHPGQVAFPGGKLDDGEDAVAAALREAQEELAIPPGSVRLIGTTDRYQTGTGFDITPSSASSRPILRSAPRRARWKAGSKRRSTCCSTGRAGLATRCSGKGRCANISKWITRVFASGV